MIKHIRIYKCKNEGVSVKMHKEIDGHIPSKKECLNILVKYDTPPNVIEHCKKVAEIALKISSDINNINKNIIMAGALLHDIGRSLTHSISHGLKGAQILEKEKIDRRVINVVKNHIGTGITESEAKKLNLPIQNYTPKNLEEIIVSFADKLTSGEKEIGVQQAIDKLGGKFGYNSSITRGLYRQKEIIEENKVK